MNVKCRSGFVTVLEEAVKKIDDKIPEELRVSWATVKMAIEGLPEESMLLLLRLITRDLLAKKQCLVVMDGDDLRVVKNIQTFLIKD